MGIDIGTDMGTDDVNDGVTVSMTMADAVVEYLTAQRLVVDGKELPLFPGVFAIFGHGNVTCLGHALEKRRDRITTWRGQNEQGMALAAIAYAKAWRRRQIMVATSSIGPGATNMVTAAGVAMANRLPVLLMAGDTFQSRIPDPVLQQVEHEGSPSSTVNDAFRSVVRYWDRIVHPAQVITSLPNAIQTMLDPATCGPAFIALPQDLQAEVFPYPVSLFEPVVHQIARPRASQDQIAAAAHALRRAKQPLIIAGGGVHYSLAEAELAAFASAHSIPIVETMAGKSSVVADHPCYAGPIGVTGCEAANQLAASADVVLAIGTRLQDFTTGSWTVFEPNATIVGVNVNRLDATKRRSLAVVGDAKATLVELGAALHGYRADHSWMALARAEAYAYRSYLDTIGSPSALTTSGLPSYAQVVRAVWDQADPSDVALTAAGGFPGELNNGWQAKSVHSFDCEYGFSCMGYELSGGWGAAMARRDMVQRGTGSVGETYVFVGDGSYLMMNSDIYSSVLTGHKMTVLLCDNGGFAVINRLQVNQGGVSFNNFIADSHVASPFAVDFAAHAASMGAAVERVVDLADLPLALARARAKTRTAVICIQTDPSTWTEGGAFWEVGVPQASQRREVLAAGVAMRAGKVRQRLDRKPLGGPAAAEGTTNA
jgi:3D-(3,5/4)-trihydroxycyclohexane-1,2-dione acylhydrolase (decyclizing)